MNAVESISKELDENGYAVLREIGDKEVIRQARLDLMDLLSAVPFGDNEFIGRKTKRLHSLFGQTRSIDSLAIDSLVLSVVNSYLGDVILGASVACQIYPDEDNQTFHYDDGVYPLSDKFREVKLGVVWAIDDFTIKNGATRIIPKSHGDRSKYPDDDNHIQIDY